MKIVGYAALIIATLLYSIGYHYYLPSLYQAIVGYSHLEWINQHENDKRKKIFDISDAETNSIPCNSQKGYDPKDKEDLLKRINNNDEDILNLIKMKIQMKDIKCNIEMCGFREGGNLHKSNINSDSAEELSKLIENLDESDILKSSSSLLNSLNKTTIWDLMDALKWNRKELKAELSNYNKLQNKISHLENEIEKYKEFNKSFADNFGNKKIIDNEWPKFYIGCSSSWENILPSSDARYEMDESTYPPKMAIRLDDVKQPTSISDKYEIQICKENQKSGAIRIRKRAEYCHDEGLTFTKSKNSEYLIRKIVGEDDFRFQIAGPEIILLEPEPIGWCRYIARYNFTIIGIYHVNFVWTHERWGAVNEIEFKYQPSHLDYPLGFQGLVLHIGDDVKLEKDPSNVMGLIKKEYAKEMDRYNSLPYCNKDFNELKNGRWILRPDAISSFTRVGQMFLNQTRGKYVRDFPKIRAMIDYKNYHYLPYNCKLKGKSKEELSTILKNKSVGFVGDSQIRGIMKSFLVEFCGYEFINDLRLDSSKESICVTNKQLQKCESIAMVEKVCYSLQPLGDNWSRNSFDFMIANFGQHAADGENHWDYEHYASKISMVRNTLRYYSKRKIWVETVAFPFRKDPWIISYNDWRTSARLRLYNKIANDLLCNHDDGIQCLPAFQQTFAFELETWDNAHYPPECLSGIVSLLIEVL